MGGLDNSSIFLSVPEAETSKIKWSKRQWGRFHFETSSLASLVDGHRLPEHTYDLSRFFLQQERERGRELSGFFIRPLILSYLDSTLKTSFDFCYLLIGPVAKYSHTGVSTSTYDFWGDAIQSTADAKIQNWLSLLHQVFMDCDLWQFFFKNPISFQFLVCYFSKKFSPAWSKWKKPRSGIWSCQR